MSRSPRNEGNTNMATNNETKKTKSGPEPKKGPGVPEHVRKASAIRREVGMGQPGSVLAKKPLNALATTFKEAMTQAKNHLALGLQSLTAAIAMKDLPPRQLSEVHDYAAVTLDAIDEAKSLARARVLDNALKTGTPVGESGLSREVVFEDGTIQRVTIQKSGLDPKKFEAALRAKGAPVQNFMAPHTTWKLLDGTESSDRALQQGLFTQDELDAMKYEPTYRVDRTKEAKHG